MFRRAVFANSRREVVLATKSDEQFAGTVVWLVLAYAEAIVESFRKQDDVYRKNNENALKSAINQLVAGLFPGNINSVLPDFLARYEKEDLLLELAAKVEAGVQPLRTFQPKGSQTERLCPQLSRYEMANRMRMIPGKGLQRPWKVLADLVDCVALFRSSTMEVDSAQSLVKRMEPVIPKLMALGTPCSLAAVDLFEHLKSWDEGNDLALVMLP